ncbi:ISL3 family transposase [Dactylosporangium darangshiense]|uniref:ISL3 family transposase n=1 Tax=Dactylosporangium darangshiense TaxID=579108 RepID=UPI00364317D5
MERTHVRVTTAFNRVLKLPGAWVDQVSFTDVGIVIGLRRRTRLLTCPCGWRTRSRYDSSRRRWRHLDFGACKVFLEADVYRIDCGACLRVRTEQVPWARPNARHTSDFEDLVAWLAQRMDKTAVSRLLRCSWEAVDHIVTRVVAEHIDDNRLNDLFRIGVDEISYRRGRRFLTIVADHDTGRVVWVGKDRSQKAFEEFFDALGERTAAVEAITLDGSSIFKSVAEQRIPRARICLDPFHVIGWANEVVESTYRAEAPHFPIGDRQGRPSRREWRRARYAVRAGAERLDERHQTILNGLRRHSYRLWRAWELKEQLRDFYRIIDPADARAYLNQWCTAALRSRIPAYHTLVGRIRKHFDAIASAVELGLSNSRLEGINAKIRLIQRRGYGFRDLDALTAMIYLCLGGITITLPTDPRPGA